MNIFETEKYFDTPEKMEELLNILQKDYFDRIDYHSGLLKNGVMSDISQLKITLEELNGIYMDLKSIYMTSVTIKENRELKYFMSRKIEIENRGDKFTSAPIEKEASNTVANERRVRNVLEGKIDGISQVISSLQSELKFATAELSIHK